RAHRDGDVVERPPLVSTPHPEIQTPIAEYVHRCRFLREMDRVMEGQDGYRRAQTNRGRHARQIGQDSQRGRYNAMPGEVMFGKPYRIKTELLGPEYLLQRVLIVLRLGSWLRQLHRLEKAEFHGDFLCFRAHAPAPKLVIPRPQGRRFLAP